MEQSRRIEYIHIGNLEPMPGNPKTLSEADAFKLRAELKQNGLLKSLSVWQKTKNKAYVLDGNQRLSVIKELVEDGDMSPQVPCEPVDCENMQDAAAKCLSLVGQFGRVDKKALGKFVKKAGFDSLEEAQQVFSFVELDAFEEGKKEATEAPEGEKQAPDTSTWKGAKVVKSPTDGVLFYVKKHLVTEGFEKNDIWDETHSEEE